MRVVRAFLQTSPASNSGISIPLPMFKSESSSKYNSSTEDTDVMSLYEICRKNAITIWIDGGWEVDALLGHQSCPHKDLVIAIQEKDVSKLRELLQGKGYREIKLEIARPHNFVLGDERGDEIDVHAIVLNAKGDGIYGHVGNGETYPADSLIGTGTIAGKDVRCISLEWMVKFHSGYELQEKDLGTYRRYVKSLA